MNIVDARADVVRVVEIPEGIQQFHVGTGGFDSNHIRIQRRDGFDDVVEFRIAHVGVNLGVVVHAHGGQAEAIHCPVQILCPLSLAQRQAFTQCGFVNLDYLDAGRFQVLHFIAQGQGDLATGVGAGLVVPHEGPLQNGHRAGEHAFHRLVGEGLGVTGPFHCHGMGALHVAENDRWFDAT